MTETAAAAAATAAAAGKSSGASVNGDSSTTPGVNSTIPAGAGIPFYEKQRQHLRELLNRRRLLERKLVCFYLPNSAPLPHTREVTLGQREQR